MKRHRLLAVLLIFVMGICAGCSEKNGSDDRSGQKKAVDVQGLADRLVRDGSFRDTMGAVDEGMALSRLYYLDDSKIVKGAFYTNSNATAEEVAVIEVADAEYLSDVKKAYETRLDEQRAACRDYLPDELPKLDGAVVYESGNYVILCVSENSAKIEEILAEYF